MLAQFLKHREVPVQWQNTLSSRDFRSKQGINSKRDSDIYITYINTRKNYGSNWKPNVTFILKIKNSKGAHSHGSVI